MQGGQVQGRSQLFVNTDKASVSITGSDRTCKGGVKAKLKFRKKKYYRNGGGGEEGDLRVKETCSLLNTARMPAWKHESHQFFLIEHFGTQCIAQT